MKKIISVLCLFTISVVAQQNEKNDSEQIIILTEFIVKDLRINSVDYSKEAIKDGNKLYFYKCFVEDE